MAKNFQGRNRPSVLGVWVQKELSVNCPYCHRSSDPSVRAKVRKLIDGILQDLIYIHVFPLPSCWRPERLVFSFFVQTWGIEVREEGNGDCRASNRSRKYGDIGFGKRNDKEGFRDWNKACPQKLCGHFSPFCFCQTKFFVCCSCYCFVTEVISRCLQLLRITAAWSKWKRAPEPKTSKNRFSHCSFSLS